MYDYSVEDTMMERPKMVAVTSLMMLVFLLPFSLACFVRNCPTGGKRSQTATTALRQVLFFLLLRSSLTLLFISSGFLYVHLRLTFRNASSSFSLKYWTKSGQHSEFGTPGTIQRHGRPRNFPGTGRRDGWSPYN